MVFFVVRHIEFKQRSTPPLPNNPIRGLEIRGPSQRAQRDQVVRGEGEGVEELVFVDEEVGGEGQVGM